jgi:hypothetical protein
MRAGRAAAQALGSARSRDRVRGSGHPPHHGHYGDQPETIELQSRGGVAELFAPRRYVLDSILVAGAAGGRRRPDSASPSTGWLGRRPAGCECAPATQEGAPIEARAPFTVGADGSSRWSREGRTLRSCDVAPGRRLHLRLLGGLARDKYEWFYRPGVSAGIIPTNDGAGLRLGRRSRDALHDQPALGPRGVLRAAARGGGARALGGGGSQRRVGRLRAFPGIARRRAAALGRGLALVGDASHFKDPITPTASPTRCATPSCWPMRLADVLRGASERRRALDLPAARDGSRTSSSPRPTRWRRSAGTRPHTRSADHAQQGDEGRGRRPRPPATSARTAA